MNKKTKGNADFSQSMDFVSRFEYFLQESWKNLVVWAVVFIAVAAAWFIYREVNSNSNKAMIKEFASATNDKAKLEAVLAKYPNETASVAARMQLAQMNFKAGDLEKAAGYYRELSSMKNTPKPFKELALMNLGYLDEHKQKFAEAAEQFRNISLDANISEDTRLQANIQAARLYLKLNEPEKAREALAPVLQLDPNNSNYGNFRNQAALLAAKLPATADKK